VNYFLKAKNNVSVKSINKIVQNFNALTVQIVFFWAIMSSGLAMCTEASKDMLSASTNMTTWSHKQIINCKREINFVSG
jgi:hypothetical protein